MIAPLDELAARLFRLSKTDRAQLASRLILSLDEDAPRESNEAVDAAWHTEITRRVAEVRAGMADTLPADQVFAEIDHMLESFH
jgi:putative addiction module component (TIGR02574 family)